VFTNKVDLTMAVGYGELRARASEAE